MMARDKNKRWPEQYLISAFGQLRTLVRGCPAKEKNDFDAESTDFLPQSLVKFLASLRNLILEALYTLIYFSSCIKDF